METNAERRTRKLAALCAIKGVKEVAEKAGLNPESLSQILKGVKLPPKKDGTRSARSLGDPAARKIEDAEQLGRGWFDLPDPEVDQIAPHDGRAQASLDWPHAAHSNVDIAGALRQSKGVPVVGEVKGGDDGYLEELQYPVGHGEGVVEYWCRDETAYALRVRGDSMHPRYRAGEFVVVTPCIEAQSDTDVVISLRDGRKLLKHLNWSRDGEIQLLSINNHFGPLTINLSDVLFIHRVAGSVGRDAFQKT